MIFRRFLACFKHIFDYCILVAEIVEEKKHYIFGMMQFNSFVQKTIFLLTTTQNIYIPNETSLFKKNICCIHLKRKTAKLLDGNYLFKVL